MKGIDFIVRVALSAAVIAVSPLLATTLLHKNISAHPVPKGKGFDLPAIPANRTGTSAPTTAKSLDPVSNTAGRTNRPSFPNREARTDCVLPPISATDELVLFGSGYGTKLADVTLSGDNGDETYFADVVIESGEAPLYIVLTSYSAMLWRFSGAVERVSMVVPTSVRREDNSGIGPGGSGVIGIPAGKVSFLKSWNCLPYFSQTGGTEEAQARGRLFELLKRQPDVKGGSGTTNTLNIPSMEVISGSAPGDMIRNRPMVQIDPKTVVGAVPVKKWDILPGIDGIEQLLKEGYLQPFSSGGGAGYKIVRTFPRFPTGLTGWMVPKFLLGIGVAMPKGSPGWACVISEESGEVIGTSTPSC